MISNFYSNFAFVFNKVYLYLNNKLYKYLYPIMIFNPALSTIHD